MTEAAAVYAPPPGLLEDLDSIESVATLTHDGDEPRHLVCFGRDQADPILCFCAYCWDDRRPVARAEYLVMPMWALGFAVAVCGDCARFVRQHITVMGVAR